jgi:hypothetical protein
MQKSDNHYDADMAMIRIQALEWVQGQIQQCIIFLPVSIATFFESITKALSN